MASPQHLVLTSFPISFLTRRALDDLRGRFGLFRRRVLSNPAIEIVGGIVNVEIALDNQTGKLWLLHIDAVLDCPRPPSNNFIHRTWHALGGGQQFKFDSIKPGTAPRTFAYSTKRPELPTDIMLLRQFVHATRGFRATMPFGTLHPLHGRKPQRRGQRPTSGPGGSR
jgi:hypothetical protein